MTARLKAVGLLLGRAISWSFTTVALVLLILRYWPDALLYRAVAGALAAAAMVAIFLEIVTRRRLDEHHADMKKLFEAHSVREDSWNGAITGLAGRLTTVEGRVTDLSKEQRRDHQRLEEVRAILRIKGLLPSRIESDED